MAIKDFGPGTRPALWWIHETKGRPFVRPRDWNDVLDGGRYAKERAAADLEYLRKHRLLGKEEIAALEKGKETYGPDANS